MCFRKQEKGKNVMEVLHNYQKERGITLIALVITIIVLLILAGITINLTIGENGIITRAQEAGQNYTQAQQHEQSQIADLMGEITSNINLPKVVVGQVATVNSTIDGQGASGKNPVIPKGFKAINEGGAEWGSADGYTKGLVIKNDIDGNEFVWVPVQGMSYTYDRYAFSRSGWNFTQTKGEYDSSTGSYKIIRADSPSNYYTEAMPSDEKASVGTYGGYYIGRYETGIEGYNSTVLTSNDGNLSDWTGYTGGKLVIQKDKQVWNYITRDRAKIEAEKLYNKATDGVFTKLCSSYAWDTALKFIETKNSTYLTDSTGGNYAGSTNILQPTGYHSINNIYDMGGNVSDWITELFIYTSICACIRGR